MSNIIFETLLIEATSRVNALVERGLDVDHAINSVAEDMDLEVTEVTELKQRSKKIPSNAVVENEVEEVSEIDTSISGNSMFFESADELDQATGILMYKGIPWSNKGPADNAYVMTFESSEALSKAHTALKRRWDFVEHQPRKVAVIEFDNLDDYATVLEFISRKGSMLETYDAGNLDEDFSVQQNAIDENFKAVSKEAKKAGLPLPEQAPVTQVYSARHKNSRLDVSEMNIRENPTHRAIKVRRKIK